MRSSTGRPSNNFDFLRLLAAAFVILGHHFILFGRLDLVPGVLGKGIHVIGVEIFFAISGYLVASSWLFDASVARFLLKRSLRIFPALIGVCAASVFVLGPIFTRLSLSDYFSDSRTYSYFSNIFLYITYFLPGVFEENVVKSAVNGSLWSLPAEFSMYLLIVVVGLFGALRLSSSVLWGIALVAAVAGKYYLSEIRGGPPPIFWATSVTATLDAGVYFVGGAFLASLGNRFRPRFGLAVASIVLLFVLPLSVNRWIDPILLPYAVLTLGLLRTPIISQAGRYGDFSYGLYLYAYPAQQAIYQLIGLRFGIQTPLWLATVITLVFAVISWYLIEKPALRYKPVVDAKVNFDRKAVPTAN